MTLDVNAAGKTVNTMKKSLAGNARVALKDGAIKGINLAEVFRSAKTALGSSEQKAQAREAQQTDFSEMTASFVIKNGVAHNEDLDVKAPLFRISGKGDIDIGNSKIDYVTNATVVASTKGQGGADLQELSGLTVPVHLVGPFDALKYQVDYSAAASQIREIQGRRAHPQRDRGPAWYWQAAGQGRRAVRPAGRARRRAVRAGRFGRFRARPAQGPARPLISASAAIHSGALFRHGMRPSVSPPAAT